MQCLYDLDRFELLWERKVRHIASADHSAPQHTHAVAAARVEMIADLVTLTVLDVKTTGGH